MQAVVCPHLGKPLSIKPYQLRDKRNTIAADPFGRRPFLYLDTLSWLDSKIENLPVQEVMRRKFGEMR